MAAQNKQCAMSNNLSQIFLSSNIILQDNVSESILPDPNKGSQFIKNDEDCLDGRFALYKLGENTCRACLKQNLDMQSLFTEHNNFTNALSENELTNILDMFISCTSLEISMNDQYPKHICQECLQELLQAFQFWSKCRSSIKELEKINEKLSASYIENEIDLSIVKCETILTTENDTATDIQPRKVMKKKTSIQPRRYRYIRPKIAPLISFSKNIPLLAPAITLPRATMIPKEPEKHEHICKTCRKIFSTGRQLVKHRQVHKHPKRPGERTCRKCGLGFPNRLEYNRHAKKHNTFLCPHCGHISNSRSSFNAHLSSHSNLKPFACESCDKKYKSLSSLQVHKRNHTGEMRYTCEHCSKKFITWNSMKSHIRTHHMTERPYVCPICFRGFKQSSTLITHKRQHTGEKPYSCNECTMCFRSKGDLNGHMVKHTGERNYACTICEKRFARTYNLTQHMITHTGERRHKCDICNKAFTQAHVLRGHLRTHGIQIVRQTQNAN